MRRLALLLLLALLALQATQAESAWSEAELDLDAEADAYAELDAYLDDGPPSTPAFDDSARPAIPPLFDAPSPDIGFRGTQVYLTQWASDAAVRASKHTQSMAKVATIAANAAQKDVKARKENQAEYAEMVAEYRAKQHGLKRTQMEAQQAAKKAAELVSKLAKRANQIVTGKKDESKKTAAAAPSAKSTSTKSLMEVSAAPTTSATSTKSKSKSKSKSTSASKRFPALSTKANVDAETMLRAAGTPTVYQQRDGSAKINLKKFPAFTSRHSYTEQFKQWPDEKDPQPKPTPDAPRPPLPPRPDAEKPGIPTAEEPTTPTPKPAPKPVEQQGPDKPPPAMQRPPLPLPPRPIPGTYPSIPVPKTTPKPAPKPESKPQPVLKKEPTKSTPQTPQTTEPTTKEQNKDTKQNQQQPSPEDTTTTRAKWVWPVVIGVSAVFLLGCSWWALQSRPRTKEQIQGVEEEDEPVPEILV